MKRLSLKKPVIVTGLVLTLMLTLAVMGMSMNQAHAAEPMKAGRHHPSAKAMTALKLAAKKSSSCKTSNNVYTIPCTANESSMDGSVVFTIQGQKLAKSSTAVPQLYTLYSPLNFACATTDVQQGGVSVGALDGTATVATDRNGRFSATVIGTDCLDGNYNIVAQWFSYPSKVYTASIKVKAP